MNAKSKQPTEEETKKWETMANTIGGKEKEINLRKEEKHK